MVDRAEVPVADTVDRVEVPVVDMVARVVTEADPVWVRAEVRGWVPVEDTVVEWVIDRRPRRRDIITEADTEAVSVV